MAWYDNTVTQGFLWTPSTPGAHSGVDLGCPVGTPVTALLPGVVRSIGNMPWGGQINIASDVPGVGPVIISYLHTSRNLKQPGTTVKAGTVVALSGTPPSPKYGNGPHVHFEVSRGSQAPYMDRVGPSNPISGMFLISAARSGQLDAAPNAAYALTLGTAAQVKQGVAHAPGFFPIVQAIDRAERYDTFNPDNPLGWFFSGMGTTVTRLFIAGFGLVLLLLVIYNIIRSNVQGGVETASQIGRLAALTGAS
jgi:murein DD-endopeptidase MepM/ murein hydrolase activator NlpD